MNGQQAITAAIGVSVCGSAISKVMPDFASIRCAALCTEPSAEQAMAEAKKAAAAVQRYLREARIGRFGASRVTLSRQQHYVNGEHKLVGYQARVSFQIELTDLDTIDEVVVALVEAGANEIESISFETTRLQELRAEARRLAIADARAKALDYCEAAGIILGRVLHVEDANPLQPDYANMPRGGGLARVDAAAGAFDPSMVTVSERVLVAFAISA